MNGSIAGLIATIIVALTIAWKWLAGGNDKDGEILPVKAEIIARENKMIIEIPIEAVLRKQDEVLADLRRDTSDNGTTLARLEGTVDAIKKTLDDANPWAQSVEKRFQEQGQSIAVLKSDVNWIKDRVRKFHDGDG